MFVYYDENEGAGAVVGWVELPPAALASHRDVSSKPGGSAFASALLIRVGKQ